MKLRNKKTGEIVEFKSLDLYAGYGIKLSAESITELNEEWEDYEESKEYWYIEFDGEVYSIDRLVGCDSNKLKQIGNYFDTREEAEKAVEKLKAWKRLKDKGFRFDNFVRDAIYFNLDEKQIQNKSILKDLDLLFGGEE